MSDFQLVVINYEGNGYYVTSSSKLGRLHTPLRPEMASMVAAHRFVAHVPDPNVAESRALAAELVESHVPAASSTSDQTVQFFGTYYLNLNAFQYGPPPAPLKDK